MDNKDHSAFIIPMDSHPSLEPWTDPADEARVVAWVLGEASEFEQAEVERLLADNPELAAFARRIQAVHGLLGAAHEKEPEGDEWKLAPERRTKIEDIIGTTAPATIGGGAPLPGPGGGRGSRWRLPVALVAACLVLALVVGGVMTARNKPLFRMARIAGIEAKPSPADGLPGSAGVAKRRLAGGDETRANLALAGEKQAYWDSEATPKEYEGFVNHGAPVVDAPSAPAGGVVATAEPPVTGPAPAAKPASASVATAEVLSLDSARLAEDRYGDVSGRRGDTQTYAGGTTVTAGGLIADAREVNKSGSGTHASNRPAAGRSGGLGGQGKGEGWGFGGGGGAGAPPPPAAEPAAGYAYDDAGTASVAARQKAEVTSGVRSGDFAVTRNAIDAILNGRPQQQAEAETARRSAAEEPQAQSGIVREAVPPATAAPAPTVAADEKSNLSSLANESFPVTPATPTGFAADTDGSVAAAVFGDVPVVGKLFAGKEEEKKERAVADGDGVADASPRAAAGYSRSALGKSGRDSDAAKPYELTREIARQAKSQELADRLEVTATEDRLVVVNGAVADESFKAKIDQTDAARVAVETKYAEVRQKNGEEPGFGWFGLAFQQDGQAALREQMGSKARKQAAAAVLASLESGDAASDPVSTFSLHVSDSSFKLGAFSLLERGQLPDPAGVRTEDYVNAFDYGDPPPPAGEAVSCALDQAVHPFVPGRNLVRIGLRTAATGRASTQPLRLTVLLDNSGSMERPDRAAAVQSGLAQLASLLKPGDQVTLIGFSRTPRLLADRLPGDRAKELPQLARQAPPAGGTNIEAALDLGAQAALRQFSPQGVNRVVLVTDGAANLGNIEPEKLAARIEALRQQKVAFDACGVGTDGLDDAMLEALARKGDGRYFILGRAEDADAAFARELAGAFRPAARNVKVQVRFNPDRVGKFHLLGFEKHVLKEEDFRDDKVDAAEMAAAEEGNALYQVELRADGQGEIGDVAVRFEDVAAGRIVERHWTIPFDPSAARLERANPSMQLAATAGLLAERLKGSTLGGLVQLDDLTPVVTSLRQHFPANPKAAQLVDMVRKTADLMR